MVSRHQGPTSVATAHHSRAVLATAMFGAFVVGSLTVVQSRINGELGKVLDDGIYAAWLSFGVGLIVVAAIALLIPRQRASLRRVGAAVRGHAGAKLRLPPWQLLGGLGGATFVAAQGLTVQYLGVAVFTVAVVAAQNGNSLFVDRFGLGPAGIQRFTARRVIAALIATLGVAIAVSSQVSSGSLVVPALLLALFAGAVIAIQQAINGRVAVVAHSPWSAGFVNFVVGWLGLTVALLIGHLVRPHNWVSPPNPLQNPVLWFGGLIGVTFIVVAASVVRTLGVLLFALLSIAGQVTGALVLDIAFPEAGRPVSVTLVVGVLVTGGAVALAAVGRASGRGHNRGT